MSSTAPPLPEFVARLADRRLFPDLAAWAYLNHAAISPLSRLARAAMGRAIGDVAREGVGAVGPWMAQRARLRAALAGFLDCRPESVALTTNTGAGIRAVALGFPWQAGDRVLLFEGEFPANITPWQQAAALFGLKLRFASLAPFMAPGGADLGEVEAALAAGVRLVAISAVQFRSGLRMPVEALGELCRRYGAALCVDAAQSVGIAPLLAGSADFVAAPGHKWLMGPEGTGFLVIHPDQQLRPVLAGWLSHEDPADFLVAGGGLMRYDKPIRASADFLEGGAPNLVGFAGLEAGLAAIQRIGRLRIFSHVQIYLDALEAGLRERGFVSLRAPDISRRSGILSVECPPGVTAAAAAAALRKRGVSVTTPDGALRFSPHWPNAHREVPRVLETLDEALREVRGEKPPTIVDIARARGLLPADPAPTNTNENQTDSE